MSRDRILGLIGAGLGLVGLILLIRLISTDSPAPAASLPGPVQLPTGDYVGSAACQSCHKSQHAAWHDSYHRTMTQPATEQSVLGDFNNVRLTGKDLEVRLFRDGERFMAELNIAKPPTTALCQVVLTTGSHYRQAYWMVAPNDSHLLPLPFMYLKAEKRWIPRYAGYINTRWRQDQPEIEMFKGEYGRWSTVCLKCHTTHGQPEPVVEPGASPAFSRVAEFGISCEACHGPGAAHVRANSNPKSEAAPNSGIVNPAQLTHERSSEVCGQCHTVFFNRSEEAYNKWLKNGDTYQPGSELFSDPTLFVARGRADQMPDRPAHVPDPATTGIFWSDGMIRVTGREFNGLIESPCYKKGEMTCLSCHEMHQKGGDVRSRAEWAAGQLKPGMDGNRACVQCHDQFKEVANVTQHTHHAADSAGSKCYNCHMPNTTYGILKATKSHQVHSPSVAVSLQTGRPNGCNQCHQDKTLGWTADRLAEWYKQPRAKLPADEEQVSASVLWALRGDAGQRAITAWSFGWSEGLQASGNHWQGLFLAKLLDDPYPAVRFIAHRSLKRLPGFADFSYDFVGPPEARSAAAQHARQIWEQTQRDSKRPPARQTLIDPDGRVMEADFRRLFEMRDDKPLNISE